MIIYRCNKCGKETDQVHLNKVNEGVGLCDDCFLSYSGKAGMLKEKYEKDLIKIKKEYEALSGM